MTNNPQFNGTEKIVTINFPYGVLTGDVAIKVRDSLLEAKVEGSDLTLADAGFALRGKFGIRESRELWGSNPDMLMTLWHYVPTKDFGFLPATPQQIAKIYNENPEFIKGNMWLDSQMIRNGFTKKSNGVWADMLNEEIRQLGFGDDQVLAIPYSVVKPVIISNGHLPKLTGYTLIEGAKNLIRNTDWNKEQVKGFKYEKFDENLGIPLINSGGNRTFHGLSNNIFSALGVDDYLNANGNWGFGNSSDSAQVVGWRTDEAR